MFQSTRPRGTRPDEKVKAVSNFFTFQSTRPRGARPHIAARVVFHVLFQSTRPRGARPQHEIRWSIARFVSIHAPARGATTAVVTVSASPLVFQSTRPRGARLTIFVSSATAFGFQSTRPRGARRLLPHMGTTGSAVSIHAPARGATAYLFGPAGTGKSFNPRAREGRDEGEYETPESVDEFQSTRPRGARRNVIQSAISGIQFQSTRPRGARHRLCMAAHRHQGFQSTRPRGARLGSLHVETHCIAVSIHAPARGATELEHIHGEFDKFQSTRPRGARPPSHSISCQSPRFNPRAREGRDRSMRLGLLLTGKFQSTRPRGARPQDSAAERNPSQFQSTRPRGARLLAPRRAGARACGFNPRAREGRDDIGASGSVSASRFQSTRPRGARRVQGVACAAPSVVSIHAPARGATGGGSVDHRIGEVSIHAPARGATWSRQCRAKSHYRFNPRAREERDSLIKRSTVSWLSFNPRAREGRDFGLGRMHAAHLSVSIHAPARGATLFASLVGDLLGVSIHAPARGATLHRRERHDS